MGMGVVRCLKILALLSLVPLALRAGSLLGHVATPPSSQFAAATSSSASVSRSAHTEAGHQEGAALPAGLNTARFWPGGGGSGSGGLGEDKRMAPSRSNPLHNLR